MERALLDDPSAFEGDSFFAVPRQRAALSIGEVLMPALCRDVVVRMPMWLVAADAVDGKLAGSGVVPRRFGRWAVVAISLFRYGSTTVGPYTEVGLLVVGRSAGRYPGIGGPRSPLRRVRRAAGGLAAVELALDNEVALAGGVELLGLRKYMATIDYASRGDWFEFGVRDATSGAPTVTVSGRMGPGVVVRSPTLFNVGSVGGEAVHIRVDTDSSWRVSVPLATHVAVEASDGHLGGHIADLGLARRRPFCVLAAEDLRGRLHLPARLVSGSSSTGRR